MLDRSAISSTGYCVTMSDSTTKPQVALVGAHSDSFVQALQAADFNVEQRSSILDVSFSNEVSMLD